MRGLFFLYTTTIIINRLNQPTHITQLINTSVHMFLNKKMWEDPSADVSMYQQHCKCTCQSLHYTSMKL